MKDKWKVYLVKCNDNSLYCGITNNINRRMAMHQVGKGSKYVRAKGFDALVWESPLHYDRSNASKLEYQIKQWTRAKKDLLISNTLK